LVEVLDDKEIWYIRTGKSRLKPWRHPEFISGSHHKVKFAYLLGKWGAETSSA
jgi:hypothetical protein